MADYYTDDMGAEESSASPYVDNVLENQNAILAEQNKARATHLEILKKSYQKSNNFRKTTKKNQDFEKMCYHKK